MDWYEIAILAVIMLATLWSGWQVVKQLLRRLAEAFIVLADAVKDDKLTRGELKEIVDAFSKVWLLAARLAPKRLSFSQRALLLVGAEPVQAPGLLTKLFPCLVKPASEPIQISEWAQPAVLVHRRLKEAFPSIEEIETLAGGVWGTDEETTRAFVSADLTDRKPYIMQRFVCYHYTWALRVNMASDLGLNHLIPAYSIPYGFGEHAMRHAFIIGVFEDSILVLEPQTDVWLTVEEALKHAEYIPQKVLV